MPNSSEAKKFAPEEAAAPAAETPIKSKSAHAEAAAPELVMEPQPETAAPEAPKEDLNAHLLNSIDATLTLEGLSADQEAAAKELILAESEQIIKQAKSAENPNDTLNLLVQTHLKDAVQKVKDAEAAKLAAASESAKAASLNLAENGPLGKAGSGKEYANNPAFNAYAAEIGQEDVNYVQEVAEMYDALDDAFKVGMPENEYDGKPLKFDGIMMPPAPKVSFFKRLFRGGVGAIDIASKKELFAKAAELVASADVAGAKDVSGNKANVDAAYKSNPGQEGGIK